MMTTEKIIDGLLLSRAADMRDLDIPPCPCCKGQGVLNDCARSGRNRYIMCLRCLGTGNRWEAGQEPK